MKLGSLAQHGHVELGGLRLERRTDLVGWRNAATPFVSGAVALLLAALVLVVSGHNPISTYHKMIEAALTSRSALTATFVTATPIAFTGLAAAVAFRMRAWNIGGEGQLYAGAICSAAAGIAVSGHGLAAGLPAMIAAGAAGGALWAAIPGLLRSFLRTSEILTSLMLNYVAGLVMYYLIFDSSSYLRDLTSPGATLFPQGKQIAPDVYWPSFHNAGLIVPLGFLLAVVLAGVLYFALRVTRLGFQVRVIADSPEAARYAGMRTRGTFVTVMVLSGALAGLAGASQIGDFSHLLDPVGLQPAAYGYTGIVAAALARYNPLACLASAFLLGGLTNAGFKLQGPDFPHGLVGTIEGIVLFCVLGGEVLSRYRVRRAARQRQGVAGEPAGERVEAGPEPVASDLAPRETA